jgi:hypothetical protein
LRNAIGSFSFSTAEPEIRYAADMRRGGDGTTCLYTAVDAAADLGRGLAKEVESPESFAGF